MIKLRVTSDTLTDGSKTYAVKFEAKHDDTTDMTVTIECNDLNAANHLYRELLAGASFAYTDGPK